ncbi:MAG: TonB-dependent receptor domain-containing protein, partial [Bradymonadaceae bacterium]
FHDSYRAAGGALEVGATDLGWADETSVRVFGSDFARDLQHNIVMTVPYGEARFGETASGSVLRYEHAPSEDVGLDLAAGYNFTRTWFEDTSDCNYDWFGRCTSEREHGGEIGRFPSNHRIWEHAVFGRFNASWAFAEAHELRLSVAPTVVTRTGEERADTPRERDPLAAQRDLVDFVSGLEYELDLFDGRLENIAFVKDYVQVAHTRETLPSGQPVDRDRATHQVGFGDSLRYSFTDWFRVKFSYEWATRLPSAEEIFGNGVRIQPNAQLDPERSHNANLELSIAGLEGETGTWRAGTTGFARLTDDQIVLLGGNRSFSYRNVLRTRALGVETALGEGECPVGNPVVAVHREVGR